MAFYQTTLILPAYARGIHIITPHIQQALNELLPQGAAAGMITYFYNTPPPA